MGYYRTTTIFEKWGADWIGTNRPSGHVAKAIRSIARCRTSALGGRLIACQSCGYQHYVFQSCSNRNCPICPALKKELWLLQRQEEVLAGVDYFHIVYTLPHEWNALLMNHPREMYNLFFRSVKTCYLKMIGDSYGGAQGGLLAMVHTWGQNLSYHPHIHTIVPGAGLSSDEQGWVKSRSRKYLLDVVQLSKRFKKEFIRSFIEWWEERPCEFTGQASCYNDIAELRKLVKQVRSKDWVVYSKAPTKGADQVLAYLSRYVHRVAFSESRILEVNEQGVHFGYKNYREDDEQGKPIKKDMWLEGMEFISRFTRHILPKGFQRIRYYGIWSNATRLSKLAKAKQLLEGSGQIKAVVWSVRHFIQKVLGIDPDVCPGCGQRGRLVTFLVTPTGQLVSLTANALGRSPPEVPGAKLPSAIIPAMPS